MSPQILLKQRLLDEDQHLLGLLHLRPTPPAKIWGSARICGLPKLGVMSPNQAFRFQISNFTSQLRLPKNTASYGKKAIVTPSWRQWRPCLKQDGMISCMPCTVCVDQKTVYHGIAKAVLSWSTDGETGSEGDRTWPKSHGQEVAELGFHPIKGKSCRGAGSPPTGQTGSTVVWWRCAGKGLRSRTNAYSSLIRWSADWVIRGWCMWKGVISW